MTRMHTAWAGSLVVFLATLASFAAEPTTTTTTGTKKPAPKPLFRDPVHDGAADPVIVWNRAEKTWFMLYTNRRANVPGLAGVAWVHGTRIGIAQSADGGTTWAYRGVAEIDWGTPDDSHWAPDVIYHDGVYHMYLTFVPGMHTDWSGTREIVHLTSNDLLKWTRRSSLKLASDRVIDAGVVALPDGGGWRMYYNNETDRKSIYYADSADLSAWTDKGKAIGDRPGEGPKVFRFADRYWMIVDVWDGMAVYRSDDLKTWLRQRDPILKEPGRGADDGVKGGHADVVVSGDRAFLFYFTHPGRRGADAKKDGYEQRRSSIQVAELHHADGELRCDRDAPTFVNLKPPADEK
jgi:hypothetical protein